jgi:hypothetical protein
MQARARIKALRATPIHAGLARQARQIIDIDVVGITIRLHRNHRLILVVIVVPLAVY